MATLGKWYLHVFYSQSNDIRKILPPTGIFYLGSLKLFLDRYKAVYIKPDQEHKGKGIIKAWKTRRGYAFVVQRGAPVRCGSLQELYREIKKRSLPQRYIIQKAIPKARIRGRDFDFRVMMMRNLKGRWVFFGLYAKVAGPRSVVTNISNSRGYVTTFEKSVRQSLGLTPGKTQILKKRLIRLSGKICEFAGKIKYYEKIGIDFAVDRKGNVWLIEVNMTYPGFQGFSRLPDKTAYRRIRRMNNLLRARRLRRERRKTVG